jgi:hypothetical protein
VIADALVERHPELSPALPALVADGLTPDRPPRELIADALDVAQLRALWALVLDELAARDR